MRRQKEITNRAAFVASAPPAARLTLFLPAVLLLAGLAALPLQRLRAAAGPPATATHPPAADPAGAAPGRPEGESAFRILDDLDAQADRQGGYADVSATELHVLRSRLETRRSGTRGVVRYARPRAEPMLGP